MKLFKLLVIIVCLSTSLLASLRYEISNHKIKQGHVSKVYLYSSSPISGHLLLNKQRFTVYPVDRFDKSPTKYVAYIAIHRWMKPGAYQLVADIRDQQGENLPLSISIRVRDAQFKKRAYYVSA